MAANTQEQPVQTFEIVKQEEIAAPVDIVFELLGCRLLLPLALLAVLGRRAGPDSKGIETGLGLAAAAVLGVHRRVAVAEARGDAGPHRALAVAAVGQGLGSKAVGEQVAADELNRLGHALGGPFSSEW